MSLSFKEKIKNLLSISGYIAAGGIGSLLILFLIRKSFALNQRAAKKYHRQIQVTLQELYQLEKEVLQLQLGTLNSSRDSLDSQIEIVNRSIEALKELPNFLSETKQNVVKSKIEGQASFLTSQNKLLTRFQNSKARSIETCSRLVSIKQEVIDNQNVLGSPVVNDRELLDGINNLLDLSTVYCQSREASLVAPLQNQISEILLILEGEQFDESKFFVSRFTDLGSSIIEQNQIQQEIGSQLELESAIANFHRLEAEYLAQYWQKLQQVSNYRLATSIFVLLVVALIAYKIISNLARTNNNIVKILENFTKELESKVEERTAQLEESILKTETALAQAQNANQAKSRFLANMSHELRTPLNAILGFTQLMTRDTAIGEEQQENLKIINRSGEHLLTLINDILEMSKIEVGQITLNETQFDLHLMLRSIEDMLRLKANAKNLNLFFDLGADVPRIIETDEGKLRQIIINLLGNALKFTETGSVVLKVRKKTERRIAAEQMEFLFADTYDLYFGVEDTGPGIEPEEIEQLFSPFEQTKVGRDSNEGSGLGLSICYKFVELMGGELKVESVINRGSIFYFQIPLQEQERTKLARPHELRGKVIGLAKNQAQYRILAVDDVSASRILLNKLLTGIGFEVKEAGDGQEAIAVWEEWRPDLILMDMRMPILDGYEATRQIKAREVERKTAIIALTASAFEEERVEILSAGCDDFMRKPFQEAELFAKIGQYLDVEYIYEQAIELDVERELRLELTRDSLGVMPELWRSQLYNAAAQVNNQEIFQLLEEIPDDYQALADGLADLAEQFRCDKIIDLAKSGD